MELLKMKPGGCKVSSMLHRSQEALHRCYNTQLDFITGVVVRRAAQGVDGVRRWVFVIVLPSLAADLCPFFLTYVDCSSSPPVRLNLRFATLLHDVTCSWIHPLSGANNPSHWGLPLPQQYIYIYILKKRIICSVSRPGTLTMQYAAVHHQYCCSSYYRTHTVSIYLLALLQFICEHCLQKYIWMATQVTNNT